jgi:uncharacterized repeat protein (TIGR01451 family)
MNRSMNRNFLRAGALATALFSAQALADVADLARDSVDNNTPLPAAALAIDPQARARALAAIPAGGLLLVTDSTNKRVMALSPQTGVVITANFIVDAVNLTTPLNAVLSPEGTRVLVSDQVKDTVNAYDLETGAFLAVLAPQGGVNNALIDNNRGIDFASNGDLLVTIGGGGNVDAVGRFSALTGAPLTAFVASGSVVSIRSPFDIYRIPRTIGALSAGQYLVSSADSGKVTRFDANGTLIAEFATAGTFAQQIFQASNGNILVGGFGVNADGVFEFTPQGVQIARLDDPNIGGYRGVYELTNGNVLTTTGGGVFELNRTTGVVVNNQVSSVQARYIEFVQGLSADLSLSKIANMSQVNQGASVDFTLSVRNLSGTLAANNVLVSDPLPVGLSYQSNNCSATVVANTVSFALATLAANSSASCVIRARADVIGSVENRATVTASGVDPQPSNNSAAVNVSIVALAVPVANRWGLSILAGLMTLVAALWMGARRD